METRILQRAASKVASLLRPPPRILSVERTAPSRLQFLLEWPAPPEREAGSGVSTNGPGVGRQSLVLDVHPAHSTLHLVSTPGEERLPAGGSAWERLAGGRILAVEEGSEARIRLFRVADRRSPDDTGDWTLAAEWIGRSGNLRLLDRGGAVVETLLPGGPRPGEPYRSPPEDRRPLPATARPEELAARLAGKPPSAWPRELARHCRHVSVVEALNAILRARPAIQLSPDAAVQTQVVVEALRALSRSSPRPPGLYLFPRRAAIELEAGRTEPAEALGLPAAEVSDVELPALAAFLEAGDPALMTLLARAHEALLRRAADASARRAALHRIGVESSRLRRLRENLLQEQGPEGDGSLLRRSGEAILTHMHKIRRGDVEFVCPDHRTDEAAPPLRIALDPARTPAENAQVYFHKARRWERGEPHRAKRLAAIDRAFGRLSALAVQVEETDAPPAEAELDPSLAEALGFLRRGRRAVVGDGAASGAGARRGRREDAPAAGRRQRGADSVGRTATERRPAGPGRPGFNPRTFTTREGWTVLVGRSNAENDHLTHRMARPDDYWFHAHAVPGSHVVLRREGRKDNPSAKTLEEAASIAAFYSRARHSGKVPVIYTLKKYVRKPRGAKAGLATCTREKTILVPPKDPTGGREPEWMEE